MKILIASDFHLGLSRKANFTAESSARREQRSRELLGEILKTPHDFAVCAGDFFDKYSNPENTIIEAMEYARNFDYILAGNHDSSQRNDTRSSLDVLAHTDVKNRVVARRTGSKWDDAAVWFVPHSLSQELFLDDLEYVQQQASHAALNGLPRILITHCSYDMSFELSSSSLNLPRERAEQLLTTFDYVLLGHEHIAREDFGGRLQVIGSHYVTAFDNLTDKRHLVFDTETRRLDSVVHWRAGEHVYVGPGDDVPSGLDFYDLSGDVDPKLAVHLFKAGALGVRVAGRDRVIGEAERPVLSLAGLPQQIARELARNPELLAIWESLQDDEVAAA